MTGNPIKFRAMSSANHSGVFNDVDTTQLTAANSVVTRSNSNLRKGRGTNSSATMFKRNQNSTTGTHTNAKAMTYMTGFNNGSAVRASANIIRGADQISSQASGFLGRPGHRGTESASSNFMDHSNNLGGFTVVPSGALDSNNGSPQITSPEVTDLPPD